jgi:hypothetical protein
MADVPDIVYELPLALLVISFLYLANQPSRRRRAWSHHEEQIAARLSHDSMNGRVVWSYGLGSACIAFESPAWGGALRLDTAVFRRHETWRFSAATTRPLPRMLVEGNASSIDVKCDAPGVKTSFDLHVLPFLMALGGQRATVSGKLGGHRVNFVISLRKGLPGLNLLPMLHFMEPLMAFVKDFDLALDPDACRNCGEGRAEGQCGRCGAAYHAACHSEVGVCHVWGCGPKQTLLAALHGPPATRIQWV